jgi:hypothetical protein
MKQTNLLKKLSRIFYSVKISGKLMKGGLLILMLALTGVTGKLNCQVINNESFDGATFVPTGWTNFVVSGSPVWSRVTAGVYPTQAPHSGAGEAMFNSYNVSSGTRALITPPYSLVNNTSGAAVSFWMYRDNGYNTTGDVVNVYYNTSANLTGATLLGTVNRAIGLAPTVSSNGWYQNIYSIPNTVTGSAVYFILAATSQWGNNIYIDDVSWTSYPPTCSGTPNTPAISVATPSGCPNGLNISATGLTSDAGITNQWQISPTSGGTYTNIVGANGSAYSGPQPATAFYQLVSTCTISGLSATSTPVSYTVVNPGPCVCTTYASSGAQYPGDEDIWSVVFGTLNNVSTCSTNGPGPGSVNQQYSNYAGFVAAPVICMGASIPFTVNINTCNGWYGMQVKIFIDYNQNGSFLDTGEEVYYNSGAIQGNNTGSVAVPLTAVAGITRMRIVATEFSTPPATGLYGYGETEDYCVNISAPPSIGISANTGSVCPGASQAITASGATTYSINGGPGLVSASNITLSPLVSTIYTITGTDLNGCSAPLTSAPKATITTLASPSLTIAVTPTAVCVGQTATLTVTGANTYTWAPSTQANSITASPGTTSVYTVSGTGTNVCNGVKQATLLVNQLPTVTVNSGTICAGKVYTMVPSGAASYIYTGGSNTVSPSSTTSFSVTGTSTAGCVSASPAVSTVTVFALPVVTVNSGTLCSGNQFVILPTGSSNYSFTGNANPVSPTVTTSYSVTGSNSLGCVSLPAVSTITVFNLPSVTITGPTVSCSSASLTLTTSGAVTYTWSNGSNGTSITETPTANANYYVIGEDANGCTNFTTLAIHIDPQPNVTTVASKTFVCVNGSSTITASGALSYLWNNGSTTSSIAVTPSATTSYSVTGTNTFGCTKTIVTAITVNTMALAITGNTLICAGNSTTLTASGMDSYSWNGSPFNAMTASPLVTTSYTMNAVGAGCPFTKVVTVSVNPKPSVSATLSNTMICVGESATLTATGATTYSWSNGNSGAMIVVTPTLDFNFIYTVNGVDANGCENVSNTLSLKVDKCVGVSENSKQTGVSVYPNPGTGEFTIKTNPGTVKQIDVTDVTGRVIYTSAMLTETLLLNISDAANGIYYVKVKSDNSTEVLKIVKQ